VFRLWAVRLADLRYMLLTGRAASALHDHYRQARKLLLAVMAVPNIKTCLSGCLGAASFSSTSRWQPYSAPAVAE
jgi:hypothetical protein